jgi:hypothetical protein
MRQLGSWFDVLKQKIGQATPQNNAPVDLDSNQVDCCHEEGGDE